MSAMSMNLLRCLAWEFRLQWRYYFWLTGIVITLVWLILFLALDESVRLRWMPILIFADLSNIGVLFIAGLLYLERRQGTLYTYAIMPVPAGTWVLLKLISLSTLISACALTLVAANGLSVTWPILITATLLTAAVFTLIGFLLALPFDGILNYFLGMALVLLVLNLPLFAYFDVFDHWIMWAFPSHPALLLLEGSFTGMSTGRFLSSALILLAWIVLFYTVGVAQFRNYVALRPQS